MAQNFVIYGLTEPNGGELRYVGQSKKGAKKRLQQHLNPSSLKRGTHKACWLKGLLRRNQRPELFVIEECASQEDLDEAERHYIAYFRSLGCRLTNRAAGGREGGGYRHTPEAKAKVSRSNKGYRHTDEAKARMSASRMGHPTNERTRAAVRAANLGKPVSAETRAKIGAANRGRKHTPEAIAKITAASRAISDETRAKLSAAAFRQWARKEASRGGSAP